MRGKKSRWLEKCHCLRDSAGMKGELVSLADFKSVVAC